MDDELEVLQLELLEVLVVLELEVLEVLVLETLLLAVLVDIGRRLSSTNGFVSGLSGGVALVVELAVLELEVLGLLELEVMVLVVLDLEVLEVLVLETLVLAEVLEVLELLVLEVLGLLVLEVLELEVLELGVPGLAAGAGGAGAAGATGAKAGGAGARGVGGARVADGSASVPQHVTLPSPLVSSIPDVPNIESDLARAASPTVNHLLATVVTDPSFESTAAFALVTELIDFAATRRLDYVASLVTESDTVCPLSVGGELALGNDVLEDRQFELECLAAALPRFATMLLCPEGDPDALDIPTPRSYAEAITGEYSSQWLTAMDAEMAS
ncbi:unnamed protein product [Closterium sp. Yama58-4]|nr:unnamed protein product [Closterium sp. Yama58-4]